MRKKYTLEFKEEAVKLVTEQGFSKNRAALILGVDRRNIKRWIDASMGKVETRPQKSVGLQKMPGHEEIKQLRKEVDRLKMERYILKKATAFFINEKI